MPRPNKERTIDAESTLAERISQERVARGWSCADLASAMTDVGCAIQTSAIYKIESGTPRRRVTVNEAAALSRVWNIPIDRLIEAR